ncbi:S-adenosyl-L-homocysteine hydrolase [Salmonella enterica subsp. arizonae]|uniref:S-adenosyl-L-homocysteine hydrolase n=1 Tax=Salmonella enterica subsp. arizonae TaxID=59203 RepID=A0A447R4G5_SALER|nr:S-adenosyl-L-homocysteine hydrolase [Salmonella enterica subsp. arizonae]
MLNLSQKKRNSIGNIMSKTNEYNIKDMALADQGLKRINWAKNHMPIMRNLISRLEKKNRLKALP